MTDHPFPVDAGTREVLLLAAATHLSPDRVARLRRVLTPGVAWPTLVRAAMVHRVLALVYHTLKQHAADLVPDDVMHQLRTTFLAYFRLSFSIRTALPELLELLAADAIRPLVFKGPALAAAAYGDDKLRPYSDVDLLVRKDEAATAAAVLEDAGFRICDPLPDRLYTHGRTYRLLRPWHGNACGFVRAAERGDALNVDLHWGLASHYFQVALDPAGLWDRRVTVALEGGLPVETFSPEDTLLHVCLHGTKHNWRRLSYVCDVAEVLRAHPALDVDALLARAASSGCERMVHLGVAAAGQLLGAPVPAVFDRSPADRPELHALVRAIEDELFRAPRLARTLALHVRARDRRRDALGTVLYRAHQAVQPSQTDRDWVRIPHSLAFLYYAVRPVRLITDALRRSATYPGSS